MFQIEVNNKKIEAKSGEYILEALKRAGIKVPTLCHIDGLPPSGACRMCVVEVEGIPGLVPSCAFPVQEDMKIKTHSPRVLKARKSVIELLLANHPDDCLYCPRNGNCELQHLSEEHSVDYRRYFGKKQQHKKDTSSPSIVRDPEKCILCGRCVRVCEEVQGVSAIDFIGRGSRAVVGTAFDEGINISNCINCGQCIMACPTGALTEQSNLQQVVAAIQNPEKTVVVQHAPAVSVTLGEEFGAKLGADIVGIMTRALREAGFDKVFETAFSADLTIMEEATELVKRIKEGGKLPMMTSCSPGWIKYVEEFYPDFMDNLSTCKSPQQMLGAIIKTYYAEKENLDPENIFSVAVMPCVAKKFEAGREEMGREGRDDIDAVLTTRELVKLFKMKGIDINKLDPDSADTPFGERSSAGKLFAATGGVMEAAVRTAHYLLTGRELPAGELKPVRGMDGIKEARLDIGGKEIGVAVAHGLENARRLLEEIKQGKRDLHFVEIMTCPGGCIGGGGQPIGADTEAIKARMQALYKIDKESQLRTSHGNEAIKRLYDEFLGEPSGEKSHELLHTKYVKRDVLL